MNINIITGTKGQKNIWEKGGPGKPGTYEYYLYATDASYSTGAT